MSCVKKVLDYHHWRVFALPVRAKSEASGTQFASLAPCTLWAIIMRFNTAKCGVMLGPIAFVCTTWADEEAMEATLVIPMQRVVLPQADWKEIFVDTVFCIYGATILQHGCKVSPSNLALRLWRPVHGCFGVNLGGTRVSSANTDDGFIRQATVLGIAIVPLRLSSPPPPTKGMPPRLRQGEFWNLDLIDKAGLDELHGLTWAEPLTFAVAPANVRRLGPFQEELSDEATIVLAAVIKPLVSKSVGAAHKVAACTSALQTAP